MFSMFTPEYIDGYTDILRESAENFYNNIIGAIDPEAELEYVYLD